ncbi:ATP-binding cassette domain-containing protein [Pelagimonas varians]|uniref:Toxin RTX-I translocation ATP-binding protein n=1 Tax=Pelagimonas varians TaxID=696760 RepID=A0A238KS40_9RHOB|nr:ATP-binding cassette domain-containing protein [Pelagimonas varians]PYG28647.1 ATP-binding cassette subfamily C protein LapB [Pelagimonas varians]SMX45538.1 Toxin RTX-I translocation ATP-binding protein [Pelagimonas varians]
MADRAKEAVLKAVPAGATPSGLKRSSLYSEKATSRADMIRMLAGRLGVEARRPDVLEALAREAGCYDSYDAVAMKAGLEAAGLIAELEEPDSLVPTLWPAIAMMTNGQTVLVLGQQDGGLTIYDETGTDMRSEVAVAEFGPYFSGQLLRAEAPVQALSQSHASIDEKSHWFWGQFKRFSRHFGEVALGSFVANLLAVSVALFSLQVYDRVIPHQSEATLWVLAAGAGMALLLEAFLKVARSQLLDGAGRQIELGVQKTLMDKLLGMRSDLAGRSPSQLFSAMREFGSVREFFTASTVGSLADIPFIFVFLALVWSIAGSVVWVLIAGGVLMVIPGFLMQKKMIRLTQEMQGASSKQSRLLQEVVVELDTIKTQRAEDRFARSWEELVAVQALKSSEQRKLAASLTFWSQGIQQATYVGAVITGTYLVFAGEFTVGSIIAVGILSSRTLAPLTQLSGIMARWGNVKGALDGLDSIAHVDSDRSTERTYLRRETLRGEFELRDATYRYDPEGAAVLDLQAVKIPAGQVLAVLGANGSGKSTLLKMLTGLYAPSSGKLTIDGTEMSQIDPRDLRRTIGYLGQDVRLFHGTLRDNLNLNLLERNDDRLFEALDFAGLGQFVKSHPKGLDLDIHDGGEGMSVGQRQSIGWARLWLQDPDICLLDEPTAALDQNLEKTLISRLEVWLEGRTAVIATHRVPILSLASRTMVLANGRMAIDGPRDQVLDHLRTAGQGAA